MLARADHPDTDDGPRQVPPGTERLCIATRTIRPVADMIRFVVGPEGEVVPDLKRKLPGRGVWTTASRAAVEDAVRRRAFVRGFKEKEVRVAPELADLVERLLERATLDALSIAFKAGLIVTGFTKVEAALTAGKAVALVHAADASPEGARKLGSTAKRRYGTGLAGLAVVEAFTSAQLDLALGRSNVIHAALLAGPASDGFLGRFRRLERFRRDGLNDRA